MSSRQKIVTAARAVTVAGVAGGALAVGVGVYQAPVLPGPKAELTASVAAEQVIPFERARRSVAQRNQSGVPG